MSYGFGRTLDVPVDDAIGRITAALAAEGFGILTRIDVHQVLKAKIGADLPAYVILGACNPRLAHASIGAEPEIGLLLPCNVLVREVDGGSRVDIADPSSMGAMTSNAALTPMMADASTRLRRALHAC
jgi:uncharacterized protein (DUF302 family)